jgi:uncharacterized membrane protein YfcA
VPTAVRGKEASQVSPFVLYALAGLVVTCGALIQGSAGLGMNLLAAPLLALLDPSLVPVPLLAATLLHSALTMYRELDEVDWRGTAFAVTGRVPGTVVGVLAVALLPARGFAITIGVLVLVCVLVSLLSWTPQPTSHALFAAGLVGGALGTSSAIGAPPVALLYQHFGGPKIRATLAAYMLFGTVLSLVALGLGGQIGGGQLQASAILLPFMIVGFGLSGPLRHLLDRGWMRPAVLGLAASSSALLVVTAMF